MCLLLEPPPEKEEEDETDKFAEKEIQTNLVLIDERYDRIIGSNEAINEIYREEILREKYL